MLHPLSNVHNLYSLAHDLSGQVIYPAAHPDLVAKHNPTDSTHYLLVEHKYGYSFGQLLTFGHVSLSAIHY